MILTTLKRQKLRCSIHGEFDEWTLPQIASSNGAIVVCWSCLGDFYAANLPKVERVSDDRT